MYIQITERCNMSCAHCGFSCTKEGEDMSKEVFMRALDLSGDYVSIGGGEPTIHPKFWDFLIEAISYEYIEGVWLATNGSVTDTAIKLANLARKGVIACALSQDSYHDEVDQRVYEAFGANWVHERKHDSEHDMREVRNSDNSVIKAGRAEENEVYVKEGICICDDTFIKPDGHIKLCGCINSPIIGTVDDTRYLDDYSDGVCWNDLDEADQVTTLTELKEAGYG